VDLIFPLRRNKVKLFFKLNDNIIGEKKNSKIERIKKYLRKVKCDYLFITAPENVAWTLNIRGYDNPNSPIPNSYLLMDKIGNIHLLADKTKTKKIIGDQVLKKEQIINFDQIENFLTSIKSGNIVIDFKTCSLFLEKLIRRKLKISKYPEPIYAFKSIKNQTEINHMVNAHLEDGLALTRFIYWIKHYKGEISEIDAQNKLETFRKKSKNYLYPSFNTIAGAGPNGAIVHYRANKKNCRLINKKDIFLFDSGGQYKYGTTDVTRTICFQKPTNQIKDIFTRVLKGHIAVYNSNLIQKNTGKKIDVNARKFLKQKKLDYAHGTGHGVGFFLNVHEGPQSISKYNTIKLKAGMILSNEPGFYKKGSYGIRIENLVYVKKVKKKIYFENLTFVPIEKDLINYNFLTKLEKNYLFKYHLDVYSKLSKYLSHNERKWLASYI
jgi:Xaa-Pro aminopeptidase